MAALEQYGVLSYAVPVTETVVDETKTIPKGLEDFNFIAFTSANAVAAFSRILDMNGINLGLELKFCAIGPSTSKAVEDTFRKPDIVPEKSDAASLAEEIVKNATDPGKLNILWPCGVNALPDFKRVLSNKGVNVACWECYWTEAIEPGKIKAQLQKLVPWDLVFFAAPSAVNAFADAWEDRAGFIAAAIGPTTEKALVKAGYVNIVTSKGTSLDEYSGAIVDALNIKIWS